MNTLLEFGRLGFHHIANPEALDHILFLVALLAGYTASDWRQLLKVVTAFTIGHSLTLAGVATGTLTISSTWVEFLIPATIVLACIGNVVTIGTARRGASGPAVAGIFGLIHGAGFANYLSAMFQGKVALPLLGFNIGIEMGQIALLALGLGCLTAVDRTIRASTPRFRTVATSLAAGVWALTMVVDRWP